MPTLRTAPILSKAVVALAGLSVALALPTHARAGGAVKVSADVVGMKIFIDGADTGLTAPATIGNLSPGQHEVRVRGDCRVGATLITIQEGETATTRLSTAEGRGLLTVQATPAAAQVAIDGKVAAGPTPVSCGEHSVSVTHPGHLKAVIRVEVDVDERRTLPVQLEEVGTATLIMTVSPDQAEVLLDGTVIGTGTTTADNIPAGPHIIEVRADGFKAASQQLLIDAGDTRAYTFDLQPTTAVAAAPPAGGSGPAQNTGGKGLGLTPMQATGIGAAAVGVGLGIYGITRFGKAGDAYAEYTERSQNGPGPESEVNAIRTNEVVPLRNAGLVTTSLGTLLLAGGVTLVVAF